MSLRCSPLSPTRTGSCARSTCPLVAPVGVHTGATSLGGRCKCGVNRPFDGARSRTRSRTRVHAREQIEEADRRALDGGFVSGAEQRCAEKAILACSRLARRRWRAAEPPEAGRSTPGRQATKSEPTQFHGPNRSDCGGASDVERPSEPSRAHGMDSARPIAPKRRHMVTRPGVTSSTPISCARITAKIPRLSQRTIPGPDLAIGSPLCRMSLWLTALTSSYAGSSCAAVIGYQFERQLRGSAACRGPRVVALPLWVGWGTWLELRGCAQRHVQARPGSLRSARGCRRPPAPPAGTTLSRRTRPTAASTRRP